MFLSFVLIALITAGGLSLSYLLSEDEPLLWRVSAGNIIGCVVFSLISFVIACFFGFTPLTIAIAIQISLLPLLLFLQKPHRAKFERDWQRAKGKLEGASFKKIFRFGYYAFFLVLFCLFFIRAILVTPDGIFTGASQNYGDLPFHLGAIFSFTDGNNFPPENPSYAFAKFSYPFMADFLTAAFVKLGASVRDATFVQNVWLAFSLLVVLERFTFKLTGSKLAGKIAPVLLFFSGGLGFLWFFADYRDGGQGFFEILNKLPSDYTIGSFRWGNSLTTLFVTQRSLLFGMPLTIIVLQKLWEIFTSEDKIPDKQIEEIKGNERDKGKQDVKSFILHPSSFSLFFAGLLAGTLPLIHVHSLAVLFMVTAFLFFFRIEKLREWLIFGAGVTLVAVPELVWTMTNSATRLTEFIAWHFGWDKRGENFLWFWLKNTGALFPVLIFAIYLIWQKGAKKEEQLLDETAAIEDEAPEVKKTTKKKADANKQTTAPRASAPTESALIVPRPLLLLFFYLPFLVLFLISNLVKFAPWEWDNVKILIYWFVGSLPLIAMLLAWAWNQGSVLKIAAVVCLFVLTSAGALDVWRTISKAVEYNIFSRDSVAIAEQIKQRTAPNALFLNAPTFNTAIALSGRRSLMRYTGHLASYGIDFGAREAEVKMIYAGDATAELLLDKYGIEYIIVSPEERSNLSVNEKFFTRFPVIMEVGQHRIYQVKK